ncbi:MAG: ABC transporter substrate-binding protein [Anaerolineae bacterium]|nr:ABC transporter substrate-binding protein [Anaerolineae bacterium]
MKLKHLLTLTLLPVLLVGTALRPVSAQEDNLEIVRIAFIGHENGSSAPLDRQLYQAAVTAADQINAGSDDDEAGLRLAGGDRYALEIVYYPADTAEATRTALTDAVDDDAVAVLGPHARELAAALRESGTQGLAVLSFGDDAPAGDTLFRLTATLEDRATAAADYLVTEQHLTRIGVFSATTDEALAGTAAFKRAAGTEVIVADFVREADEDDFAADVQTLRDVDAEALLIWTLDSQAAGLLAALHEGGWQGQIIYSGLNAGFVAAAGTALTQELYGLSGWTPAAYDAASQAFVADYVAQWGDTPPDEAAAGYDAIYLLANSITAVGLRASSIRSHLAAQTGFSGVQGEYRNGGTTSLRVIQVQDDGRLMEVVRYAGGSCQNCPDTWWVDTRGETTRSTATFRIGLIATLDGAAGAIGEQVEQAARLALREINEAGGVIGANGVRYTLDLVTYSASSATAAGSALQQAAGDGVQVLIGPDYNGQVLPNLFQMGSGQPVQLVSATADHITAGGGGAVYQLRATDATLAGATAHYLLDVREVTRLATVAVLTDYGLDAVAVFGETVRTSADGEIVLALEHDIAAADFAALADQIVAARVEAVAVWSTQPAFTALAAELEARGWDSILAYGYLTPDLVPDLSRLSFEVISPVNWWAQAGDWISRDFSRRYTGRYGAPPIPQAAAYYDAIYLIATQLAGGAPAGLQDALNGLDTFIGVQGHYHPARYGSGELTRQVVIVSVQQGVAQETARYQAAQCLVGCQR